MASIKNLKAAKKFGPGYFIKEQMDIRGWVQEELAEVLSLSTKHLNSILLDKQPLSIENARKLASAFKTSPHYWLNLDTDYRLWQKQEAKEHTSQVEDKSMIFSRMPIRDMIKKNWIKKPKDTDELIKEVKGFLGLKTLNFESLDKCLAPLCKKSEAFNQFNASYAATWFHMAKKYSNNFTTTNYDKESLTSLYEQIAMYSNQKAGVKSFVNDLTDCGVKFFVLPHLEKTYLDGAAFLSEETPVIVFTARYKRIDNFWFTLAHEIAHVLEHLNERTLVVLDNLKEESSEKREKEANEMAERHLKHSEILEFLRPYTKHLTVDKIEECSNVLDVHPAIIIGALTFNKQLSYRNQMLFNENVLEQIPREHIHHSMAFA
jgi:HTH-type transcriptional regulator / antitoxin HigA